MKLGFQPLLALISNHGMRQYRLRAWLVVAGVVICNASIGFVYTSNLLKYLGSSQIAGK
jgi:hypothetical protein